MTDDSKTAGLYKVVWTDGYARETVAERVVAERLDWSDAEVICNRLRAASRRESDWWIIKGQDEALWRGMEELI